MDRSELHADALGGWTRNSRPPDGPPVLLLHGGPGMAYTYLDTLDDEIGDGYRVAAFQRGMRGEGTPEEMRESLELLWPAYFASPDHTMPFADARTSIPAYAGIWDSAKALLPGLEVVDGAGHFPWFERPGSIRAALDRLTR